MNFNINRKHKMVCPSAQMATGMTTRIAPRTRGEWFFVLAVKPAAYLIKG